MIPLRIHPGHLAGIDKLEAEAILLPMYALRAQPQGVAGFIDWRLSGAVARLIRDGGFEGRPREVVLLSGPWLRQRVFLFGLGPPRGLRSAEWTPELLRWLRVVREAGSSEIAMAPPELPESTRKGLPTADSDALAAEIVARAWVGSPIWGSAGIASLVILDLNGAIAQSRVEITKAASLSGLEPPR